MCDKYKYSDLSRYSYTLNEKKHREIHFQTSLVQQYVTRNSMHHQQKTEVAPTLSAHKTIFKNVHTAGKNELKFRSDPTHTSRTRTTFISDPVKDNF